MPVLSFFTSFRYPVMIVDEDADMISDMVKQMDLTKGLALFINSPGGDGLAAERIINILRSYSKTGEFHAIIPSKAKSAATMIVFGACKIYMSNISELGPIDPQITLKVGDSYKRFCVYNIVKSYQELFTKAIREKGNIEPYLQQLQKYDNRDIEEFKSAIELSIDIAIKTLSSGMLNGMTKKEITKKIEIFLTPKYTKMHGRPINIKEAKKAGLNIEEFEINSDIWGIINTLYIRLNNYVSTQASKCIENKDYSFLTPIPYESEKT